MRLLDAIVDRLADELEERTAKEIELVSDQIFERGRQAVQRGGRAEVGLEALLLQLGEVQRLPWKSARSAIRTSRMLSYLAGSKLCPPRPSTTTTSRASRAMFALLDHDDFLTENLGFPAQRLARTDHARAEFRDEDFFGVRRGADAPDADRRHLRDEFRAYAGSSGCSAILSHSP